MNSQGKVPLPGIKKMDVRLMKEFEQVRKARGKGYKPRTRHLEPDGWATYTNRLFLESSPYLLQHAHNPVNWYPWGDEAFDTAEKLNRPVLVSIGYSTCHWCHVMEEENFIAIKVDREERPDIDAIYMSAVQAITGRGGWPLNVWLTHDRKPFYGGTYFPARDGDRGVRAGFLTVLKNLNEAFHSQQDKVTSSSQTITEMIQKELNQETGDHIPGVEIIHEVINLYKKRFDPVYGGISVAPKFPSSLPVRLLLRYSRRTGDGKALDMAEFTLKKMAAGGIYDQVAGGFHRYSTDEKWLVPHFEKMIYDNALLAVAYLEGFQVTGNSYFKQVVEGILNYVSKEMTSPEGAFYSATDADSLTPEGHREEGHYFTWTPNELEKVLGKEKFRIIKEYYAIDLTPDFEGRHILNIPKSPAEIAAQLGIPEHKLNTMVNESNELLYRERNSRPHPLRDEKILTAWNGLMISAYARAGRILVSPEYIDRAVQAADFVLDHLVINNRLYRSYSDNRAIYKAYLDDYAFFIAALIDLYEATQEVRWLDNALKLDTVLEEYYEDKENGGFFMTGTDQETLIAREKPGYDGAEPSGNSVAVMNLMRLYEFTTEQKFYKRAENTLRAFLGNPQSNHVALSEMLLALDFFLDISKEIIIVTLSENKEMAEPFLAELRKLFMPNAILIVVSEGKDMETLSTVIPAVKGKLALDGKTTAYVCEKGICKLPTVDPLTFLKQISRVEPYWEAVRE
ncbi:MAG: thioredoxin domain-containing protein [Deltaproteobacteria bacterium]|nr:thioredoxin domain-containing protein [Deltaproteobacteria bacterium]